jgi:hypothetical protein
MSINWTAELEDSICSAIALTPKGLEHICKANEEFPCPERIYAHRNDDEEFSKKYTRAKANQVLILAEQIIDIADDSSKDTYEVDLDGITVKKLDREVIERAKIRIDTRKWLASKLAPKIFGDKSTLALTDPDGGPLVVKHIASDGE